MNLNNLTSILWNRYIMISNSEIDSLIGLANRNGNDRSRLCLHRSHSDRMQQMIICLLATSYVVPHRQLQKFKSYILMEGKLKVLFFDEDGTINEFIVLDEKSRVIRFDASIWHTVLTFDNDHCIYIEMIDGPYDRSETEWASWAPNESMVHESLEYVERLKKYIG